ncbi:1-phosphatidylinositol 4,5-bisphosphate phosphodiesterase delta-3-A-like [Colossoma macropomum]|uniref:1-phosphatidylinositol 4,5-bisphosphate phosphodiesterase delta-3-A-like n=1 Tax=Colossoma macropomum TaxID=42526 RepID=UPI0018656092|nr:1-phosphatidylinositol 4,5-bisphosphate phosphodiesterase delta-3-A-like [Colossoma macropomum]
MLRSEKKSKAAEKKKENGAGTSQPKTDDPLINLGVQDDEDVKAMLQGSTMLKVRFPHWQRRRTLKLLDDGVTVHCEYNKSFSKPKTFSVMDVVSASLPHEQRLTIVFKGKQKTLDLQCNSREEAQHWARGIHTLQRRRMNMSQAQKLNKYPSRGLKRAEESGWSQGESNWELAMEPSIGLAQTEQLWEPSQEEQSKNLALEHYREQFGKPALDQNGNQNWSSQEDWNRSLAWSWHRSPGWRNWSSLGSKNEENTGGAGTGTDRERRSRIPHTWIQTYLTEADLNHDGQMTYDEVRTLLRKINLDLNEQYIMNLFKKCDQSANGCLDEEEIEQFRRELLNRAELDEIFHQYSSNGHVLSTVELQKFLNDQGEDNTLVHAQSLILTNEFDKQAKKNQLMMPNSFTMYMLSRKSDVFNLEHTLVYQDMRQPLSHYFISASHNTYLTKDQLVGESSTDPYIRALSHGCRCVELDCWDGDKEPMIYHGHTLTSKVTFREVVETIAEYAFKASPYPLILSLENHCSVEQQTIMARQLRSILGDKLLTEPLNDQLSESLPSPEELKGKILVKGKKKQVKEESVTDSSYSEDESKAEGKARAKKEGKEVSELSAELSDLVVYTHSVSFKSFEQAAKSPPNEMSSFSERRALRHIKTSGVSFVRHNSQHLSRTYPSGQRLQSSNYNPQDMWNVGCQIVALNFQTDGEQMDLNRGRFLPNGRCGYVLKPSFLCQADSEFNPDNPGGGPGHNPTLLTIKVISAQQLPKPDTEKLNSIVDPLVRVETHGVPIDNNKKKTHRIDNNGFNPRWDCTLEFLLHVPELVLVRFVVVDHDHTSRNDFLGQFTLPFTSMRTGYRHVWLLKADGSSLSPASLFIHVKVTPNYSSSECAASTKASRKQKVQP